MRLRREKWSSAGRIAAVTVASMAGLWPAGGQRLPVPGAAAFRADSTLVLVPVTVVDRHGAVVKPGVAQNHGRYRAKQKVVSRTSRFQLRPQPCADRQEAEGQQNAGTERQAQQRIPPNLAPDHPRQSAQEQPREQRARTALQIPAKSIQQAEADVSSVWRTEFSDPELTAVKDYIIQRDLGGKLRDDFYRSNMEEAEKGLMESTILGYRISKIHTLTTDLVAAYGATFNNAANKH